MSLFDLHSKDVNSNWSNSGSAVRLKFDTFHSLENHIRSVYYNAYTISLYFLLQFINAYYTIIAKSAMKYLLKRSNCQQSSREIWIFKKVNIMKSQKRKAKQWKGDIIIRKNL